MITQTLRYHSTDAVRVAFRDKQHDRLDALMPGLYDYMESMVLENEWNLNTMASEDLGRIFKGVATGWLDPESAANQGFAGDMRQVFDFLKAIDNADVDFMETVLPRCGRWNETALVETNETLLL